MQGQKALVFPQKYLNLCSEDEHIRIYVLYVWHKSESFMVEFSYLGESDVTYSQVWWPILGIRALHLTHPKCTHTAMNTHTPWTHTWSSGQPFMLRHPGNSWRFSALLKGTSIVVLRVERALDIHSPHLQFLPDLRLELATFGLQVLTSPDYKSNSLTIRPRLWVNCLF